MPKNASENNAPGVPDDFVGAATAEGVTVPDEIKQQPKESPKPEVVVEVAADDGEPKPKPRPTGHEIVDIPPELRPRFNHIYKQMKASDENQKMQGAVLEKLLKDKAALEAQLKEKDSKDAIQSVRDKLKAARDNGEVETEDRLRDQLITLTTEMEVGKRLPPPPAAAPRPAVPTDPFNTLSRTDEAEITRWATAEDNNGNLVRPWASRNDNTRAPLAAQMLKQVLADPETSDMTMAEKLALVDEQMGTQLPAGRRNQSPVMGANLRQTAGDAKPKITPDQARIAKKLFPHLKEQEAYRAYLDGNL